MRRHDHIKVSILTLATLLFGSLGRGYAQQLHEYTDDQPLVIASDWEFPPYEFSNDNGQPDGYNIEVLDLILKQLKIPHRYLMQEWYQVTNAFEKREADLIFGLSANYKERPYVMTRNMLHYYRISAVRRPTQAPLKEIGKLGAGDTLVLKHNDYAAIRIIKSERQPEFAIEYHSPKEALTGVRNGTYKYFVWGERPINWKIKEFALDSLEVDETDIPAGEIRLIGYDKELIDLIDDEFARLEQAGSLERIRDKWFHPERVHNDTSPIALFIIIGALIIVMLAFLLSRLIRSRVLAAVSKSVDLNKMMTQALNMGEYYVIEYDLDTGLMSNLYGDLLPDGKLSVNEFIDCILPEEQNEFKAVLERLKSGTPTAELKKHWNAGTKEKPDWRLLHGDAIVEYEGAKPRYIINSVKDVTKEIEEERANKEIGDKYMMLFETNLIAMSFYGSDGRLIDLNRNMRKLCEFDEERERFFRQTSMFDIPLFSLDFNPDSTEDFHVCQHMYYPDINIDKYIEFRVKPVINQEGKIVYYIVTARDITAERDMYLDQVSHDRELHKTNDAISQYESQLRYLLENSETYVVQVRLKEQRISFSRSLKDIYSQTFDDYLEMVVDEDLEETRRTLNWQEDKPFSTVRHFKYTTLVKEPSCYVFNFMPTHDSDGKVTGHLGIARDITKLVNAQERLRHETARAEDSGRLKSVFLANMTHEIRTPLNAIVGFSDLLPIVDTAEERMEFIRIIRNNCDMLLRLINDILEASSMGQALAIEPVECDFAQVFDDICQTLAQRVQEPGVEFVKDNPYSAFVTTLDKGRVQQVLTNFTTNAVKYTHNGHIKVGYRHQDEGLYFYCEDTGAGIPKEKQASVFERFVKLNDFVQGTGLGLSICKSIADRCNGKIGVTSEGEGHGSTFWMWIPVKVKDMETK